MRSSTNDLSHTRNHVGLSTPCIKVVESVIQHAGMDQIMDNNKSDKTAALMPNAQPSLEGRVNRPSAAHRLWQDRSHQTVQFGTASEMPDVRTILNPTKGARALMSHSPESAPSIAQATKIGKNKVIRHASRGLLHPTQKAHHHIRRKRKISTKAMHKLLRNSIKGRSLSK